MNNNIFLYKTFSHCFHQCYYWQLSLVFSGFCFVSASLPFCSESSFVISFSKHQKSLLDVVVYLIFAIFALLSKGIFLLVRVSFWSDMSSWRWILSLCTVSQVYKLLTCTIHILLFIVSGMSNDLWLYCIHFWVIPLGKATDIGFQFCRCYK